MTARAVGPAGGAAPERRDDGPRPPRLEVGDRVEGRVERVDGVRAAVTLAGRGRVIADLAEPLPPGTAFVALVERAQDPIRLRLLAEGGAEAAAPLLRHALRLATAEGGPTLAALLREAAASGRTPGLARWALRADAPANADGLRAMLATIASPLEARLHAAALRGAPPNAGEPDLHAELRGALRALRAEGAKAGPAAAALRALAEEVEAAQVLSAAVRAAGGGLAVGFPFLDGDGDGFLQVRIEPDEEAEEGEPARGARFDLRAEFSRLGAVRATGSVEAEAVRARLAAEDESVAEALRAAAPELAGALARAGFSAVRVEVAAEPVPSRAAWITGTLPAQAALVDVRA